MARGITEKVKSYRPLGSRIVVKRLDRGEKSEGGLFIPEGAREDRRLAEVVAVGPGKRDLMGKLIEPQVKPGDMVLTVKHKGVELDLGPDKQLQILDESDCMVVVELED